MADKPELSEAEKQIRMEARRLAEEQGLKNWKELPAPKRSEFIKQARSAARKAGVKPKI